MQVQPPEVGELSNLAIQFTLDTPIADGDQISLPENLSLSFFKLILPSSGLSIAQNTAVIAFKNHQGSHTLVRLQAQGFQNPASVDDTLFRFSYLRNGVVIATKETQITNLQPRALDDAAVISLNNQIGSTTGELQFTLTLGLNLPQNGKIQIQLPVWNPQAPQDQQLGIFAGMPVCTGVQTIKMLIACELASNQLTISGLPAQSKGTTLSFTVKPLRNPYNGKLFSGFILNTLTPEGYTVEQSQPLGFQVQAPTKFTKISLTPENQVAGTLSTYRLNLQADLPIDSKCRLAIWAPKSFNIASTLKQVTGKQAFLNSKPTMSDDVVTIDGCQSYFALLNEDLTLVSLQNPAKIKDSEPFKIELFSISGDLVHLIASESSLVVQATSLQPGSFKLLKITADLTTVSEPTNIQISFKIQNPFPANNQLEIQFPTSHGFGFQDTTECVLLSPLQNAVANPASCSIKENLLTLKNFSQGPIEAGSTIGFGLQNMKNFISAADAGTFSLRSYESEQGNNFLIDQTSVAGVYQSTAGVALFDQLPTLSSYVTFEKSVQYSISFKVVHPVPKNGRVKVTFPTASVSIDNVQAIIQGSRASVNGGESKMATMISCIQSTGEVVLGGIFDVDFVPDQLDGSKIMVAIPGLVNPRSTQTTPSISVETQDQNGNTIDRLGSGLVVQMQTPGQLKEITIYPLQPVNSAVTTYAIKVASNGPMQNDDHLRMQFPQDIIFAGPLACSPGQNLKSVTCERNGSTVDFTLQFQNGGIRSPQSFTINLDNIQNPPNTKTTQPFKDIMTFDGQQFALSVYDKLPVTVQTSEPAVIMDSSIGSSTMTPNTDATYTLIFTTVTDLIENAAIAVQYPSSVTIQTVTICLTAVKGSTYKRTCTLDQDNRTVKMTGGLPLGIKAGSQVSVQLGIFTSPLNTEDQSMIVTTYADTEGLYMVDQANQNMIPGVQCKSPCKGCISDLVPSECTQCYTDGGKHPFLFINRGHSTCVSNCPDGTFADYAYQCQQCHSQCLTCSKQSECLTCNKGGAYPILYKNSCISKCPAGFYGNRDGVCVECQSPCLTCSGPQNGQCNSCAMNAGLNFLQGNTCVGSCPAGTVPQDRICKPCSVGCATCSTSPTQCLSCLSGYFKLGTTCVSQCPNGYFSDQISGQCFGCDSKCKVCQGNDPKSSTCKQCNFGYYLYNGQCVISCPKGTLTNNLTSHCDTKVWTIFDDYLMCHEVGRNVNSQMVLYFPITITLMVVVGLSIGSWHFYKQTQIYELLIAIASPLEVIALFETCRQAFLVEGSAGFQCIADAKTEQLRTIYPIISYVTLAVLLINYGMNAYSLIALWKSVKLNQDPDFVAWRDHNKKSSYYLVLAIQSAFSFKFCWLWVSSFLNQKRYNAPFGESSSRKIYNRQMTHLGISHMVCVNAPVFVIAISGLATYRWGAQIVISLIDNLIVTLSMIGVQVYLLITLSTKKYNISMHKTPVLHSVVEDEDSEMENIIEVLIGEDGEKYIEGEDGEKIFIAENGSRFAIDKSGQRVEFGARGEKIYTEADGSKVMIAPDGTKIFIGKDGKLVIYHNGQKREIQEDDPLVQSVPKNKFAVIPKVQIDIQVGKDGVKYIKGEDGEKIFIAQDGSRYAIDENGQKVEFGANGEKIYTEADGSKTMRASDGTKIFIAEDGKMLVLDQNGQKVEIQKNDPLIKSIPQNKLAVKPKLHMSIDDMIKSLNYDESKIELDVDNQFGTIDLTPPSMTFGYYEFNAHDVIGNVDYNGFQEGALKDKNGFKINKCGFLVDQIGNIIDRDHSKVLDKFYLQSVQGGFPWMYNLQGVKFRIKDICGKMIRDDTNGRAVIKQHIESQKCWDRKARLVNMRGYLIDNQGNIITKEGRHIFDACTLSEEGEFPKIFQFTKFDRNLILGTFKCKSNGKPKLKIDRSLPVDFRRDDNGKIVNLHGYLCDLEGNIFDTNGKKIFDKSVLQLDQEIPKFFLEEGRLVENKSVLVQSSDGKSQVTSFITLEKQEHIVEEIEEERKTEQTTNMQNSSSQNTNFLDITKFKEQTLAPDKIEEESSEFSVTTEEEKLPPVNPFLEQLRQTHHGHQFGYIGSEMVKSSKATEIPKLRTRTIFQQIASLFQGIKRDNSATSSEFRARSLRNNNLSEPVSKMELTHEPPSPSRLSIQVSPRQYQPRSVSKMDMIKEAVKQDFQFKTLSHYLEINRLKTQKSWLENQNKKRLDRVGEKDSLATFVSFDNSEVAILPKMPEPHPTPIVVQRKVGTDPHMDLSPVINQRNQSPRSANRKKEQIVRKDTTKSEKQELKTTFSSSPSKPATVQLGKRKNQSKIMASEIQQIEPEVEKNEKESDEESAEKITKSPKKVFKKVNDKRLKRLEGQYGGTAAPKPKKARKIALPDDDKKFSEESRKKAEKLLSTNLLNQEIALGDLNGFNSGEQNNQSLASSEHVLSREQANESIKENSEHKSREIDSVVFTSYQKD